MTRRSRGRKIAQHYAGWAGDGEFAVSTVVSSGGHAHRTRPCSNCPWRVDAPVGAFPAEAYRHSARTAYDMAQTTFGCHNSTTEKPATCAGFLLRGADHNLTVRLAVMQGHIDQRRLSDDGVELYEDYRAMAEANGVKPDDPVLIPCRGVDN